MDDKILRMISANMTSLKEVTSFAIVTMVAIAISKAQKEDKVKIGSLEIVKDYAGVILFATLCSLIFQTLRLFNNLIFLRTQVSSANLDKADFIIRANTWIFNPFAQTDTPLSFLTDNLGFSLLLIIWWLGFHTGFSLLESSTRLWILIGRLLSLIYLLFGLIIMILISQLIFEVNAQIFIKHLVMFLSIPIGAFGINQIYKQIEKMQMRI